MKNNLPNFLIVGAAKCGTSSLHNYLNQHPDVYMPSYNEQGMKVKEPRFLIKNLVKDRLHNGIWNLESYQALFNHVVNEKAIGESTVLYLYYYNEAIKNIKKYLGDDVKIIIMLRNPVDRAFSAYTHVSRSMKELLSFEEALKIEKNRLENDIVLTPMVMYKNMGLYHDMVKAYIDNFKNIHVIMHEDFQYNTKQVVKETLAFLGILRVVELDIHSKHNVGGKSWRFSFLKFFFMQDNFIKKELRFVFSKKLRSKFRIFLEYFLKEKIKPINPETKKELIRFFRNDVEKLEELLNVDLKSWKE
ncbi:MAG: sulfotransferase [Flavobacteriales bacterium]|jgi:hypothetical protein|nr:sulfotransferase [Flavobacteriales bacterium]MBT6169805.1 sulfotransferase [Flavobacteriaceae bacterium]